MSLNHDKYTCWCGGRYPEFCGELRRKNNKTLRHCVECGEYLQNRSYEDCHIKCYDKKLNKRNDNYFKTK